MQHRDQQGPNGTGAAVQNLRCLSSLLAPLICFLATACSIKASRPIAEQAQRFQIAVSFGSFSSLTLLPWPGYMSHALRFLLLLTFL